MKEKKQLKLETSNRKAIFASLADWCTFSIGKPDDFVEVTEWSNGEGYDVKIYDSQNTQIFYVTYGQIQLIKKLIKKLDNDNANINS